MAGSRCGHANLAIRRQGPSLLLQLDRCSSRRARAGWRSMDAQQGDARPPLRPRRDAAAGSFCQRGGHHITIEPAVTNYSTRREGERAQPPASVQRRSEQAAAHQQHSLTQHARCSNARTTAITACTCGRLTADTSTIHIFILPHPSRAHLSCFRVPSARPCRPLVVHEEVRVLLRVRPPHMTTGVAASTAALMLSQPAPAAPKARKHDCAHEGR